MSAILLDTVVLSEMRHGDKADPSVWQWQASLPFASLSVITLNEVRYGMRKVEKRDPLFAARLAAWYSAIIAQPKRFRLLGIDRAIAEQAADFRAAHGTPYADSLIAATAQVHGLTLATRNTADFTATGISLINPWEHKA